MDDIMTAKPGDTVKISLRGPHDEEELESTKKIHEELYPGVKFEFTFDNDSIDVEVIHGDSPDS